MEHPTHEGHEKVVVFVNGDKFEYDTDTIRVSILIQAGGGIPGQYELERRKGEHGPVEQTYTNPDEVIPIKNGDHFTTRYTGPANPS